MKKKITWLLLILVIAAVAWFFSRNKNKEQAKIAEQPKPAVAASKYNTLALTAAYFTDMENPDPAIWIGESSGEKYLSGKFSNKLSDKYEYGITLSKKGNEIPQHDKIKQARISFQLFSQEPLKKASIVYAVNGKDKAYEYFQEEIHGEANKWSNIEFTMNVNGASWGEDAGLKIYPWNPGKEVFYVDDIKIEFFGEVEAQAGIAIGPQQNYFYDFEPSEDPAAPSNLSKDIAHSGSHSTKLSGSDSYSDNIVKRFSDVATDTIKFISTSVWVYPKEDNPVVTLVVSMEKPDGKSISWQGKATEKMNLAKNEWHKINFRADLRDVNRTPDDIIKIYVWNKKGGTVYADDLEIVFGDIPKPAGTAAGVIMNMTGDPVGEQEKNNPPFPSNYFSAAPLFTPESVFLVDESGKKEGEMNPGNLSLAGNFLGHTSAQDDILIADKKNWSLYSWCSGKKKFVQTFSAGSPGSTTGKIVCCGFFEDMKQEEILQIDTNGKIQVQTVLFSNTGVNVCDQDSKNRIKITSTSEAISGLDLNGPYRIVPGNFTGDAKHEIIFLSTDGQWKIFQKKIKWEVLSAGNIERGSVLSVHAIPNDSHDRLILFYEKNHKLDYCMLDFSNGKTCEVTELKNKSFLAHYSTQADFISGSFEKANSPGLFYLNKEWRFDLKKVKLTVDGILIESQIDFQQADANRNPKYYEFTELAGGKFFETGNDFLLVLMRNCKDVNFDGKNCMEFEEVQSMPSGYLFYQYKPAD